jgi:hypothetical protein
VIGRLVKSEPSWTFLAEQSRGHSDETDTFAEEHPQTASTRRRQNSSGGTQERILRTLARSLDGMTYAELAEAGISADASRKTLPKLLGDKVGRNGRGGRRDPYRWYLIPSDDVPCRAPP